MENKLPFGILKAFFLTFVVAAMVGLAIDGILSSWVIPSLADSSNVGKIYRLINSGDQEEIPVFGSSITRRNYYPDSLDQNVYNYGMPGALYTSIEPLLKIELSKDKTTPIVVDYDHHTFFYDETNRIQLSNYVPFLSNPYIEEMLRNTDNYDWHYEVPGMRYYGSNLDYIRDMLKPVFEGEEIVNHGGVYFPNRPKIYEQFRKKRLNMIEDLENLRIKQIEEKNLFSLGNERELNFLDLMLNFHPNEEIIVRFEELVDNSDRLFILVYPPQNPIKLQGLENYDEVLVLLERLANGHENLSVINMSKVPFEENLYKDSGHMNIDGARKFSAMLRPYLSDVIEQPVKNSYVLVP
jgi:hypothetical protein